VTIEKALEKDAGTVAVVARRASVAVESIILIGSSEIRLAFCGSCGRGKKKDQIGNLYLSYKHTDLMWMVGLGVDLTKVLYS
jgi:hypothetical protein